jgi:p-methyltransferase
MQNRNVIIVARSKNVTVGEKMTSRQGLLIWGSHIKQKYITKHISDTASVKEIKAKIESNVIALEWIGNHRFGIFDLLNYVNNGYRYVYDPSVSLESFDPIGIPSSTSVYLYDYLLKHNYNPTNIDNFRANRSKLKKALAGNPLAVAVSATFLSVEAIKEIIHFIRKNNKNVPIVIGSVFLLTKLDSKKQLKTEYARLISDKVYIIIEEYGLDTFNLLLQRILARGKVENIPNLAYLDNGIIKYTERRDVYYDMNSNYPEWANLATIAKGIAFIRASQGCPFKCKFCTYARASPKFRQRSVESIRDELREIRSVGIRNIAFTDDHFATNPKRITKICKMMLEEKFDFNWFAGIRARSISEDNARLLEETGCKVLLVGLESGDDRILKLMNKGTTTSSNMKCLETLDRHNITAYGSFMLGFPGETDETFNNTINWINSSPLKLYKVFPFYLFPEAYIYDELEEHNISFFGDQYDSILWKTPTMDAIKASELLKEFILRVEKAALIYNYSPTYAFFPFLSKGYSMSESLEFLRIRTQLIKNELSGGSYFSRRRFRKTKFGDLERLLQRSRK